MHKAHVQKWLASFPICFLNMKKVQMWFLLQDGKIGIWNDTLTQ